MEQFFKRGTQLLISNGQDASHLLLCGLRGGEKIKFQVYKRTKNKNIFLKIVEIEIISVEVEGDMNGDLLAQNMSGKERHIWKIKGWIHIESIKSSALVQGVYDTYSKTGALKVIA